MIGRLARWLRALGYDTIYKPNVQSNQIVNQAMKENRTLLTRSQRLIEENSGMNSYLVKRQNPRDQLKMIMFDFKLGTDWIFSRCVFCNSLVKSIEKKDVLGKVPEHVFQNSQEYFQCLACEKLYWEGTHRKRFTEFLNKQILTGFV